MSLPGTTRTSRSPLDMSVHWGEAVMPPLLPRVDHHAAPAPEIVYLDGKSPSSDIKASPKS
jgi:hypothetical protein